MHELRENPRLRQVYERLAELWEGLHRHDAEQRYRIGFEVAAVVAGPRLYGSGAVRTLARSLGRPQAALYEAARVAKTWPEDEFMRLVGRRTDQGGALSWSHFARVSRVPDAAVRALLIQRSLDESLSVAQIKAVLRETRSNATRPERRIASLIRAGRDCDQLAERIEVRMRERASTSGVESELSSQEVAALMEASSRFQRMYRVALRLVVRANAMAVGAAEVSAQVTPGESVDVRTFDPARPGRPKARPVEQGSRSSGRVPDPGLAASGMSDNASLR